MDNSHNGWFKENIDDASRGNPCPCSFVFCFINYEGNLMVTKGAWMKDIISLVVESSTIKECPIYIDEGIRRL